MNKKDYEKPTMNVVHVQMETHLLAGSVISPGKPNTPPGARRFDGGWDDDWDE